MLPSTPPAAPGVRSRAASAGVSRYLRSSTFFQVAPLLVSEILASSTLAPAARSPAAQRRVWAFGAGLSAGLPWSSSWPFALPFPFLPSLLLGSSSRPPLVAAVAVVVVAAGAGRHLTSVRSV